MKSEFWEIVFNTVNSADIILNLKDKLWRDESLGQIFLILSCVIIIACILHAAATVIPQLGFEKCSKA